MRGAGNTRGRRGCGFLGISPGLFPDPPSDDATDHSTPVKPAGIRLACGMHCGLPMAGDVWNLVLAAGAGRRLASVTGGVPKQFWRRDGGPTLLEDTLTRTSPLASRARTVIVVDSTHAHFITGSAAEAFERVVYQPTDRGTAAGVLFGLMNVLSA